MGPFVPSLHGRVSRRNVALSPHVWFALWATYALLAASTALIALAGIVPGIEATRVYALSAGLAVIALALLRLRPPEPGSLGAHVVLATVTISCGATLLAFAPHASGVAAAIVFLAPLASIWLERRVHVVLHVLAGTVAVTAPSLAGAVDEATGFAVAATLVALWVLTACCALVLEAAETQGRILERKVGLDHLTGLGNRRTLDETLVDELARHRVSRRSLSIVSLDLNGFARFNEALGHAAGDELLEAVAATLTRCARPHDLVIRLGGDEFCLILPRTTAVEAEAVVRRVRLRLTQIAGFGSGVTAGIGVATYPADGASASVLIEVSAARLQDDKVDPSRRSLSPLGLAAELAARPEVDPRGRRDAAAPPPTPFDDRVSRNDLSMARAIWALTGAVVLVYAAMGAVLLAVAPGLATPALPYTLAVAAALGMFVLITPPPGAGAIGSHLALAGTALLPVAALVSCQPGGSVAVGTALFVGPLVALRTTGRRSAVGHLALAQVVLLLPIPLGLVDGVTAVGILLLGLVMWVLGASWVFAFEAIETQGRELAELSRLDPLTGAGNRLMLHEELGRTIHEHAAANRPMTIVAVGLRGWHELNDRFGHGAGDALLVEAAGRLRGVAGPGATVTRQGGDEFCVILPGTSSMAAQEVIERIKTAIATIDAQGVPVSAEVGGATYPFDGTDTVTLLEHADEELLRQRYPVLDLVTPLRA